MVDAVKEEGIKLSADELAVSFDAGEIELGMLGVGPYGSVDETRLAEGVCGMTELGIPDSVSD